MPKYNEKVQVASYKPMESEVNDDIAKKLSWEVDDIAASLTNSLSGDIGSLNVFVLGKDGKMTRLFEPDDYLEYEDYHYDKMASAALANCLFVQHPNGALHQVGMTRDGDDIEVTVSEPVTELALPPSPGFLARFLSWFGHKESVEKVKAYDEVKNFNDAFKALAGKKEYDIDTKPEMKPLKSKAEIQAEANREWEKRRQIFEETEKKAQARQKEIEEQKKLEELRKLEEEKKLAEQKKLEEEKKKLEEQNAKEKNEVPMTNEEWENKILEELNQEPIKDTRNMSTKEFYDYLQEQYQTRYFFSEAVLENKNATPADYYKYMTSSLVRGAAAEIYDKADNIRHDGNREKFLRDSRDLFTSMAAGLRNYVVKNTDHDLVRNYFADRGNHKHFGDLQNFARKFAQNGLENYKFEVKKQNQEMEEALKQSQPQQQVQQQIEQGATQIQQQPQPQQQQPKAEAPSIS